MRRACSASSATSAATLSARKRKKRERIGLPATSASSHEEFPSRAASGRKVQGSIAPSARILTTDLRSRPTPFAASRQWPQKHDNISSTPLAGEGKRILSRKTPAKSYWSRRSRSRPTVFRRTAGLFGHTKRNVSSTSPPFSAQPPHPRLRSPRQFTTRSDPSMPSISERAPYHRIELPTGRSGPQNFWNTCGASRKPTMRRSRSISSCTRRTISTMPSGSSELRKECDVESCAPIFQEPIMSFDAVFWVGVARDRDGIDGAIGRRLTPKNSVARGQSTRRGQAQGTHIANYRIASWAGIACRVGTSASGGEEYSRSQCNGGFGSDSGPSRGDPLGALSAHLRRQRPRSAMVRNTSIVLKNPCRGDSIWVLWRCQRGKSGPLRLMWRRSAPGGG